MLCFARMSHDQVEIGIPEVQIACHLKKHLLANLKCHHTHNEIGVGTK